MYQRILVPLDGSEFSEMVLPHAERLARALNVEIVLLHVDIHTSPDCDPHIPALEPIIEELRRKIAAEKAYLDRICSKMEDKGVRATYLLREGDVVATILETAEIMEADLIAMSTHGRTGVLRLPPGSVAEKVVHESKIPVLLIRPHDTEVAHQPEVD